MWDEDQEPRQELSLVIYSVFCVPTLQVKKGIIDMGKI